MAHGFARRTRNLAATSGGVLAFAFCGCGSEQRASTTPSPTATAVNAVAPASTATPANTTAADPAAAAVPAAMRGGWKRTMTARDWRSAGRGYLEGKWRFVIDKHGGVDVYAPGSAPVDFPTQFVVKGRRLTAEDVPVCPGQTARYAWRVSGNALTLTQVGRDPCKERGALFGGTWTRRR